MALTEEKIQEVLKSFNLTIEEMEQFNHEKQSVGFDDESSINTFITKMRRNNAGKTAQKDTQDISYDELQVAWETVKDAKEGEDLEIKKALQKKSEEMLAAAKEENLTMENAPELSEWLKINNSLDNKENAERNKNLETALNSFYQNYDKEWNLENVNKGNSDEIVKLQQELLQNSKGLNPFADDTSSSKEFKEITDFYNKLTLVGADNQNMTSAEKSKFVGKMVVLAKLEAATYLSTQKGFANLSQKEKDKKFLETFKGYLEQGAVSIMVADAISQMNPEQKANLNEEELKQKFTEKFKSCATQSRPVSIQVAEAAYGGRLNAVKHVNKRIAQKTEKRGFLGYRKLTEKWNKFAEKNPKTAMALKMAGNFGLTIGANVVGGGIGLAALGAWRTYKSVKKAHEVCGSYKAILKNPSQMLNIAASASTVVFGAWSGVAGGLDANGIIGQGFNHGFGETLSNMSDNISHGVSAIWDKVTGNTAPSEADTSFWEGLKKTPQRIINNLTVTGENAPHSLKRITNLVVSVSRGIDGSIKKAKEAKGKTWKEKALAWSGAFLSFAGLSLTDASLEHQGSGHHVGHTGHDGNSNSEHNDSENNVTAPKSFNEIFQGENKEHLERAVNAAPDTVRQQLIEEGILPKDSKFMSSTKLMAEIEKYYAEHLEANPEVLANIVNNPENQNQYIHDMKASNAAMEARRAAAEAARRAAEEAENNLQNANLNDLKGMEIIPEANLDDLSKEIKIEIPAQEQNADYSAAQAEAHEAPVAKAQTNVDIKPSGRTTVEFKPDEEKPAVRQAETVKQVDTMPGAKPVEVKQSENQVEAKQEETQIKGKTAEPKVEEKTAEPKVEGKTVENVPGQTLQGVLEARANSNVSGRVEYTFEETEKGCHVRVHSSTAQFSKELLSQVEEKTYVDPQSGRIVCGHTQGTNEHIVERTEMSRLRAVAANHVVYQDFAAQQAEGHQLSAGQLKFMKEHERLLSTHNLKVNEDGNVAFDDEKFKEQAGLDTKDGRKAFMKAQEKSAIYKGNTSGVQTQMVGTKQDWNSYVKGR